MEKKSSKERSQKSTEQQLTAHQQILKVINDHYADDNNGLLRIAHTMKHEVSAPRKKVTVMLIGNHSAGKSSFVNWYIDASIQKESAAMETTGFTWIVSGKKRDTFKGVATKKYLGYVEGIEEFKGVLENLYTEVVPSKERFFPMVDFIDTPGLTDGDLVYPYDINNILPWIASKVDLVFVFFDPHGQALCQRTKTVVQAIAKNHKAKLHYFLTMVDKFHSESERSKVLVQLSQSLTQLSQVAGETRFHGEHALRVYGIYLPNKAPHIAESKDRDFNQIDELCELIDKKLKETVQNHCENFEKHTNQLTQKVERELSEQARRRERNTKIRTARTSFLLVVWALPLMLAAYLLHAVQASFQGEWKKHSVTKFFLAIVKFLASITASLDSREYGYQVLALTVAVFLILLGISRFISRFILEVKPSSEVQQLENWRQHLYKLGDKKDGDVKKLWDMYLKESAIQE
eukprot:TRINITY_DN10290_c0_g1_i11.p1 TRINITY_DN10290_c0_g1~~TRINITY_DN10290_c0_g1_i11.p1  ORF type:complete len:486 (-),score=142.36 TRINITY_DN10290_c0_g1_i11:101-1486(-)